METWVFSIIISLCVSALLEPLCDFIFPKLNSPLGPTTVPLVGNFLWLFKSFAELVQQADIGWNPKVWEDPMEFRLERFLTGEWLKSYMS
ncbi:unnamed protein product, partial [Vitis vinifera]